MSRPTTQRARGGFTLVELLIVTIIFGIVVTGAIGFLAAQSKAFYRGADKLTALQNLRFSLDRLESDVQTAGTNLVPGQPWMVYMDDDVLAFNADYGTNIANDPGAVFYDPGAPTGVVTGLTSPVTIPNSAFSYGDTVYTEPGTTINTPGETLIFFFAPDTATSRTDDYALYRQVNGSTPQLVADHLLRSGSEPFFRYFWNQKQAGQPLQFDSVADTSLPWAHVARDHGGAADTAISAKMDQVQAVRVTLRATNGLSGPDERLADLSRIITMRNAGVERVQTCGDTPILGSVSFQAQITDANADGTPDVTLTWTQATDESMGELDVIAYTIWRMSSTDVAWGDPYLSIPAGQANYNYMDASVASGESYQYAIAAKDCTPTISGRDISNQVVVP